MDLPEEQNMAFGAARKEVGNVPTCVGFRVAFHRYKMAVALFCYIDGFEEETRQWWSSNLAVLGLGRVDGGIDRCSVLCTAVAG